MPPRWTRQIGFFALLGFAALTVASVGEADACASVWTWDHEVHGCCQLSSQTRWTKAGGDCCDYGAIDERDPSATSGSVDVPPSVFVRAPAPSVRLTSPSARMRWLTSQIPERPPDRARATTVLLI